MKIKKTYQGAIPLNRISNQGNNSELNTYSAKYINNTYTTKKDMEQLNNYVLKPAVLWSNPKPTEDFYKQTITVPNLSSYSYIEIIFYNWVDGQYGYESVKAPVGNGNVVNLSFVINLYLDDDTVSTCHFGSRLGTMNTSANTIDWGAQHGCVVFVNDKYPSSSDSQAWGVPVKILGYKL